jgi:hypothetical protein
MKSLDAKNLHNGLKCNHVSTNCFLKPEWSNFSFPQAKNFYPIGPKAKKPLLAQFLKPNSQFSYTYIIKVFRNEEVERKILK